MWGYSAIRRICLHIVCYSYYVRTLLNIRCEKHYSYYKISCLHLTGITTNLTGMCFFFPVGQIRFMLKFNVHLCHLKKKTNTPESDGSYVLNVFLITYCDAALIQREALARLTVRSGSYHIVTLFLTVL